MQHPARDIVSGLGEAVLPREAARRFEVGRIGAAVTAEFRARPARLAWPGCDLGPAAGATAQHEGDVNRCRVRIRTEAGRACGFGAHGHSLGPFLASSGRHRGKHANSSKVAPLPRGRPAGTRCPGAATQKRQGSGPLHDLEQQACSSCPSSDLVKAGGWYVESAFHGPRRPDERSRSGCLPAGASHGEARGSATPDPASRQAAARGAARHRLTQQG